MIDKTFFLCAENFIYSNFSLELPPLSEIAVLELLPPADFFSFIKEVN